MNISKILLSFIFFSISSLFLSNAQAQQFNLLHEFSGTDGQEIFNQLLVTDDKIYGTGVRGGDFSNGVLFSLNTDGTDYQALHHFEGDDGRAPFNGLLKYQDRLIGVTRSDTQHYGGVLFSYHLSEQRYEILHHFGETEDDGKHVLSIPVLVGDTLYGMTNQGGVNQVGSIYSYNLATQEFQSLYSFLTETGSRPFGSLIFIADWLYGTTSDLTLRTEDQPSNTKHGTIFRIKPDGTNFTIMHEFAGGAEGGHPYGTLLYDNQNRLYGTALGEYYNRLDEGVVFSVSLNFDDYTVLHRFADNLDDGSKPNGHLIFSADKTKMYGVTHGTDQNTANDNPAFFGGVREFGTLYQINTDGSDMKVLHQFNSSENGITPERGVVLVNNTLYGASAFGGKHSTEEHPLGLGTVYSYELSEDSTPKITTGGGGTLSIFLMVLLFLRSSLQKTGYRTNKTN